jgi:hypothetical protein
VTLKNPSPFGVLLICRFTIPRCEEDCTPVLVGLRELGTLKWDTIHIG